MYLPLCCHLNQTKDAFWVGVTQKEELYRVKRKTMSTSVFMKNDAISGIQ